jgi:hypothetical protein
LSLRRANNAGRRGGPFHNRRLEASASCYAQPVLLNRCRGTNACVQTD